MQIHCVDLVGLKAISMKTIVSDGQTVGILLQAQQKSIGFYDFHPLRIPSSAFSIFCFILPLFILFRLAFPSSKPHVCCSFSVVAAYSGEIEFMRLHLIFYSTAGSSVVRLRSFFLSVKAQNNTSNI